MKTSDKVDKILPALFAVKKELKSVAKDSENPYFHSSYAGLNNYLDEVEPRLESRGLVLFQPVNGNKVESIIYHVESGQWMSSEMDMVLVKNDMQAAGSAVTYGRRYSLGALLAMQAEDDDGEGSIGRDTKPVYKKKEKATAPTMGAADAYVPANLVKTDEAKPEEPTRPTPPAKGNSFNKGKFKPKAEVKKEEPKKEEAKPEADGWE